MTMLPAWAENPHVSISVRDSVGPRPGLDAAKKKKSPSLSEIENWFSGWPARSLTAVLIEIKFKNVRNQICSNQKHSHFSWKPEE
jgi:hypothetical protein